MSALPTSEEIARAEAMGRLAARRGLRVTECPFEADGSPGQKVLAARFVRAYLKAGGAVQVDYDDGTHDVGTSAGALRLTIRRGTVPDA